LFVCARGGGVCCQVLVEGRSSSKAFLALEIVISLILTVEVTIRLLSLRRKYFASFANVLDLVCACVRACARVGVGGHLHAHRLFVFRARLHSRAFCVWRWFAVRERDDDD
jgi:hypothetical protein